MFFQPVLWGRGLPHCFSRNPPPAELPGLRRGDWAPCELTFELLFSGDFPRLFRGSEQEWPRPNLGPRAAKLRPVLLTKLSRKSSLGFCRRRCRPQAPAVCAQDRGVPCPLRPANRPGLGPKPLPRPDPARRGSKALSPRGRRPALAAWEQDALVAAVTSRSQSRRWRRPPLPLIFCVSSVSAADSPLHPSSPAAGCAFRLLEVQTHSYVSGGVPGCSDGSVNMQLIDGTG